nr:hypothetical protein [Tanacetum cinerariifolium]
MSLFYHRECFGCGQPCDDYYCYSCTCPQCGRRFLNGICVTCIYGVGKPLTCSGCEGMLRGGFCLPYDLKAENSFNCYQDAYSFNNNSNYLPQPQYENYLCNLCGNNSHDGYDCQQQFLYVYEQEPSYNQNYYDNYYPYDLPSFPCYDNCGGSHETFECQPMDQNIDFPEKEEPSQDSDVCQLIREECCVEASEEQKQNMEDTMLELEQEVKNVVEQPAERGNLATILSTKEPEYSSSMGYENLNTTPEMETDEIIKSGVEELVPIRSENEVTLEDKREYDMFVCENSPICDDHSDILYDSKIDDDISVYDDDFEDIEYVEASLSDPEIVSGVEEENVVHQAENVVQQEEEEVDLEDISQIQDFFQSDNSLSDNFSPELGTFCDNTEETRSGNTTHANDSLFEYDSFCFQIEPDQERLINLMKRNISDDSSSDPLLEEADLFIASNNSIPPILKILPMTRKETSDNPSIPRPPLEPPDDEFDAGEEIPVVMNDKDEDVDYSSFIFVIFAKDLPPVIEVFLRWIFVLVSKIFISFD